MIYYSRVAQLRVSGKFLLVKSIIRENFASWKSLKEKSRIGLLKTQFSSTNQKPERRRPFLNWSGKTLSPGALLAVLYFSSCHFFRQFSLPLPLQTINCRNHFYGLTVQCKPNVFLKDLNLHHVVVSPSLLSPFQVCSLIICSINGLNLQICCIRKSNT